MSDGQQGDCSEEEHVQFPHLGSSVIHVAIFVIVIGVTGSADQIQEKDTPDCPDEARLAILPVFDKYQEKAY